MKKTLLFTILVTSFIYGFSQDVKYGIRGGLNISNLDFKDTPVIKHEHRSSIYIGFFATIGLSKTVSLMPELQFSAEGGKEEVSHLDYIQAPIFFRFRLSEKVYVGAGPQIGLKVPKEDDNMETLAFSGVTGIEYKLTHMLFADLRYTYGFTNVFDDNLGITAKNRNIQLGIGYKF